MVLPIDVSRVRSIFSHACIWLVGAGLFSISIAAFAQRPSSGHAAAPDNYVLIHAGTLLAVPGTKPDTKVTLVVKNKRVERVEKGYLSADAIDAEGAATVQVIDLSDKFVLPGLMDAHVHLRDQPSRSRGTRARRGVWQDLTAAEKAVNAMIYARQSLAAGFTTVRDVGSDDQSVFAVRNAINAGRMIGPRILASGAAIAVSGGHADSTPIEDTADPTERLRWGVCDGPFECRRAVRYQHKAGADLIKFTVTGGFGSNTLLERQLYYDEIEAIVETAHMLGIKATSHGYEANALKDAIRAGVDSIEHGFLLDDEALEMMKEAGTVLVPTISASYPPPIFNVPNPTSVALRNEWAAFERAYAAGVKIAFGTDAGTFKHGTNAKEFDFMVQYGMQEMDAIYAATIATAELFGIDAEAGTLESGKLADVIALNDNPLDDIAAMHNVTFVMKSGKVAKQNGQMTIPFSY
jgi:imidazolonepropionase-like amidohydrolase